MKRQWYLLVWHIIVAQLQN